jgi:hypothetical protein
MTKPAATLEDPSHEPKEQGCCGESRTRHGNAQPAPEAQVKTGRDTKREHTHHADGSPCCCGSGKKGTSQRNRGEWA